MWVKRVVHVVYNMVVDSLTKLTQNSKIYVIYKKSWISYQGQWRTAPVHLLNI